MAQIVRNAEEIRHLADEDVTRADKVISQLVGFSIKPFSKKN